MSQINTDESLIIRDIHTLKQKEALEYLDRIARIEKRTFPASEAFDFNADLWRKKPNTRVIYAHIPSSAVTSTSTSTSARKRTCTATAATTATAPATTASNAQVTPAGVIAYAVYVRVKGIALLHKVCVAEGHRGRGYGWQLMQYIAQRLQKEGCQGVHLWVDQGREAARRLYARLGFKEFEVVENYYGPGRTGIKMILELG